MSALDAPAHPSRQRRDCGETKPLSDFHASPRRTDGKGSYCKPCFNERSKKSYAKRVAEALGREVKLRLAVMLAAQEGRCAICGGPDPQHVDHDHRNGWVRGILCFNCNGGLGQFKDNPKLLAGAYTYLKGTTWQRVLIHPGVYQMCSPTQGRPPSRSS